MSEEYEQSIFISYAWGGESEEIVNQIDEALQQRELTIIRDKRDLGYKGSISAFMERIGGGNCVIIVISDKYLRSPNCMFELVEIAEGKEFHDRVFPIVLSNAEIYDPVRRLQYVKHWEDKLGELDQAMRGVGQANLQGIREEIDQYSRIRDKVSGLTSILKDMNTLTPEIHKDSDFSEIYTGIEQRMARTSGLIKPESGESPYMGLRYFDTSDADLFYGREVLTRELAERVQKESFLAIVGASGSGKSSIARAGLIPVWKEENERGVPYVITPTARPLESLAASLTRDSESVTATSTLIDDMKKDSRSLRLYFRKLLSNSEETKLLLVVDQFEETFTLCKDLDERKAFIENLSSLTDEENNSTRVVITLRADFYHHCAEYEGLRLTLEKHQAYIGSMTQDELREAITAPAANNGWDFQPGLVDLILQDVGTEPGALPLLSHALLETWKRRQGHTLTLGGYHEAGGVKKAITHTAEGVYDKLSPDEQTIARNIFLRLTELGEGVQDTRRRVKMDELAQSKELEPVAKVLKTLTDARLVTTEKDSAEVAHEALIREWGTLRKWLDEDRESLSLHRNITESAMDWDQSARNELFLVHRGGRLDDAVALQKNSLYGFTAIEKAYLDACSELQNREQRERERRTRLTVIASIIASVIFLALAGFGLLKSNEATSQESQALTAVANANLQASIAEKAEADALNNEQEAIRQAQISLTRQLASQAQSVNATRSSKQMIASLLAIQSLKLIPNADASSFLINNNFAATVISHTTHDDYVTSVAFSPDGKYVVSGSADGTARVWDAASGQEIARMTHNGRVRSVAFSPDGKYMVSGSADNTVRVWDATSGREIARMTHYLWVTSVAFSPDGKYVVSGSADGTVLVWDAASGQEIARMTHDDYVTSVAFSPDGKYVISGSEDNTARVWDAASGQEIARKTHDAWVYSVAFSPDGKYVVSGGDDKTARVWDAYSGREIIRITHDLWVTSISFSTDGKYVISGSGDGTALIWDAANGQEIARMTHDNYVNSVAFSPDGKYVVSGGDDNTARVWDAASGQEIARMTHDNYVNSVAFSPDGKYVVSGSADGTARVWDAASGQETAHLTHDGPVSSVAFSPDRKYMVSGSADNTVRVWDAASAQEIARMTHNSGVYSVAFSLDGEYVVSGSTDNTARVWDVVTGNEIARITHDSLVVSVAFSPDGKYVVSGSWDNTARVWDAASGQEIARITHDSLVVSVAFSPDGKYVVSGSWDNTARVWDAATGQEIARMTHDGPIYSVAFSPDGKYVVSGGEDNTARVWEAATGQEFARKTHDGPVRSVAFSPDGEYVVSGSEDTTARIWEAATGQETAHLTHDGEVISVAFSPDGEYVISGGDDNTARVWDAATGQEIARMTHNGRVRSVAFSPDGEYVISGGEDTTARVWVWQPQDLIVNACSTMPRNLTLAEWQQYVGIEILYEVICDPEIYPNAIIPEDAQEYLDSH